MYMAKPLVRSRDLLAHYRQVSQGILTVVDVETTGHRPIESRVMEVSVLQATLADGILQQKTSLINPQMAIPANISEFTGITADMVRPAPSAARVWQELLPLLKVGTLTAHNLLFDYGFVKSEYNHLGIDFVRPQTQQMCTVILSRLMLPDLPSRRLPDLVRHFQFPVGRSHRAEADTMACWLLAKMLLTEIQNESDDVLMERFARQWITLGDAAVILGCSGRQARNHLHKTGIKPRLVGHNRTPMYQRGQVEQLISASYAVQLS